MNIISKITALIIFLALVMSCGKDSSSASSGPGKGGSLARFAVVGNYLYTVEDQSLKVFDIKDRAHPKYLSKFLLDVEVETIFPRDSITLFI